MPGWLLRQRYRLEAAAVGLAARAVPCLGRGQLVRAARVLGWLGWVVDARGRRTGRENLRVVFPDKPPAWREGVLRRAYQSFAQTMLDLFWSRNVDETNWRRLVRVHAEPRDEAVLAGGALWCCPHYSCFEWLALVMPWLGHPTMVVAEDFKNAALTPVFAGMRGHSGNTMISSDGAMLRLFKNLRRGGHSSFLCDLTVPADQAATVIRCFGLKMSATILHAALSQRTGLPVVPAICLPQDDGTYVYRQFAPRTFAPGTPVADIAQEIWDELEPLIRERPEHWLWMYKHWRYLPADTEGRDYPSYANRSKKFDKLEAGAA